MTPTRALIRMIVIGASLELTGCAGHQSTVKITKQDVVRWCLNARRDHDAEADKLCRDWHADEYIAQGIKPNYDKYPYFGPEKRK